MPKYPFASRPAVDPDADSADSAFGRHYWMLRAAQRPEQLWEVCDQYRPERGLLDGSREVDSPAESVVLYGAGAFAESVIRAWASDGKAPLYCVDSNPSRWGETLHGIQIRSPQSLQEDDPQRQVLVCTASTYEIEALLENRQSPCLFAERDGSVGAFPGHWLPRNRARFQRLFDLLGDEQSRAVLMAAAKARIFQQYRFAMQGNVFLVEVVSLPQYFPQGLLEFADSELFVDCGAFDGDTLLSFFSHIQSLGLQDCRAIALEPDPGNLDKLQGNLGRYGLGQVQAICAAVGRERGVVASDSIHNCAQPRLGHSVQVLALDELLSNERPTYIKMDVEGAELDALAGARETLQRCRPKLAVCTYHLTQHLVDVPLFIADEFPGYRIFMRHHSPGSIYETVCYAVPLD